MKHKRSDFPCSWVAVCQHEATQPIDDAYVFVGTYEYVLHKAGDWWLSYEGSFDPTAECPFFFEPGNGYDDPETTFHDDGKVNAVNHGNGDGPQITIRRASR